MKIINNKNLIEYKKQQEEYYKDSIHSFQVFDVVKISNKISHDIGHKNQIGIVESLCGVNNYLYVVSYDERAERYWACGFGEKDLIKLNYNMNETDINLRNALYRWIFHEECYYEEIKTSKTNNGLTPEENEISELIVQVWNKFTKLKQSHPSDLEDVQRAVHQLQYVLGMRTLRRLYPKHYISYKDNGITLPQLMDEIETEEKTLQQLANELTTDNVPEMRTNKLKKN